MPIIPGRPAAQAFAERWLIEACTVRAPIQGGGWDTVVASAPCRFGNAAPASVAQPGGLLTKQRTTLWVRRVDAPGIRRGWDLVDETGNHWIVDGVSSEPEAPTVRITATRND